MNNARILASSTETTALCFQIGVRKQIKKLTPNEKTSVRENVRLGMGVAAIRNPSNTNSRASDSVSS